MISRKFEISWTPSPLCHAPLLFTLCTWVTQSTNPSPLSICITSKFRNYPFAGQISLRKSRNFLLEHNLRLVQMTGKRWPNLTLKDDQKKKKEHLSNWTEIKRTVNLSEALNVKYCSGVYCSCMLPVSLVLRTT